MPKFKIGERTFPTKGAALAAVRLVLNQNDIGNLLTGDDFIFIRALIDIHPSAAEKLAGGCVSIGIRTNKVAGQKEQRGFYIVHDDRSETEFSIFAPFRSVEQRRWLDLNAAARSAVLEITSTFKRIAFSGQDKVPCVVTGEMLSWGDAAVDHYGEWSFFRILSEWLIGREIVLIDHRIQREFNDSDKSDFIKFHNERALLRVIHKKENSRRGSRG
jgi:hypothetical protein